MEYTYNQINQHFLAKALFINEAISKLKSAFPNLLCIFKEWNIYDIDNDYYAFIIILSHRQQFIFFLNENNIKW